MRKILILSLLLVVAALPLAAQSLTGTVAGTVKDEQGGVLPGVTVTLAGKTGARTITTDAEGAYRFAARRPRHLLRDRRAHRLPPEAPGQRRRHPRQAWPRSTSSSASAASTETVDVVGESPVVDVASSSTDNTLSQDMLFNLPIRPENAAIDMLNFLPGINNGSAFGTNEDYAQRPADRRRRHPRPRRRARPGSSSTST